MRLLEPRGEIRMRLAAIGDVGVIGRARARARSQGWDAPFAALAPALGSADVAFANLEFPVGEPEWVAEGRSREFHHDAGAVEALARAGVRVVSLANNHLMDCGARGLARTLEVCRAAELETVGAGSDLAAARRPARVTVRGCRTLWLAYAAGRAGVARPGAPGVAPLESDLVREDLARWRDQTDLLVVSVHWGSMYVDYPPPRVLALAKVLVEGGADLVLGHHPHVTQGCRREGRSLTLFSLGDAVLDPAAGDFEARVASEPRTDAGVFTVLVADAPGLELAAATLDPAGVPHAASEARAASHVARLRRISAGLGDSGARFAAESAPVLLRYELQSLGAYLRSGRLDRAARLLGGVRPRHLPLLWQALRGRARSS
ncbi:MAG: hypothetical protein A2W00_04070 [Candidatus Eisenbacteria bacterium RBG_16_71_46]|nr:MAG: hypothetical protein A2W00_04070 [Candidatus Eisenbacteria bacterium RBG_16_71_46]